MISPSRASSNIGEFAILVPGEEHVVFTKEVFIICAQENREMILDSMYSDTNITVVNTLNSYYVLI